MKRHDQDWPYVIRTSEVIQIVVERFKSLEDLVKMFL